MPAARLIGVAAAVALVVFRRWVRGSQANPSNRTRPKAPVFIWSHPRALSTALLRSLAELPGVTTVLEPFMVPWQLDLGIYRGFSSSPLNYDQAIASLQARVKSSSSRTSRAAHGTFIIKDMPCHGGTVLLDRIIAAFPDAKHVLLVRHPFRAVPSMLKVSVGYSDEVMRADISYAGLVEYAKKLVQLREAAAKPGVAPTAASVRPIAGGGGGGGGGGADPSTSHGKCGEGAVPPAFFLVDADDLIRNPEPALQQLCSFVGEFYTPKMLTWEANKPPSSWGDLADFEDWLDSVLSSTGWMRKPALAANPAKPTPKPGQPLQEELIEENMPFYAQLRQMAQQGQRT